MANQYPTWLTRPIHLPFPFLPLPSITAAIVAATLGAALLCWGMCLMAQHWPFKHLDPVFPAGSPAWLALAVPLSLAAGVGAWKLVPPNDLATACAWDLAGVLFLAFSSRPKRPTGTRSRE